VCRVPHKAVHHTAATPTAHQLPHSDRRDNWRVTACAWMMQLLAEETQISPNPPSMVQLYTRDAWSLHTVFICRSSHVATCMNSCASGLHSRAHRIHPEECAREVASHNSQPFLRYLAPQHVITRARAPASGRTLRRRLAWTPTCYELHAYGPTRDPGCESVPINGAWSSAAVGLRAAARLRQQRRDREQAAAGQAGAGRRPRFRPAGQGRCWTARTCPPSATRQGGGTACTRFHFRPSTVLPYDSCSHNRAS
jgi:hypothetical protein